MEPLNIANKVDSPEKVQAVQDIPENQKIMAIEFNQVTNKVNELVADVNKKTTNINNADTASYPNTPTVKAELDKKTDKAAQGELEITANTDAHNVNAQGKGLVSFASAVNVTGISSTNFYDGQQVIIYNKSQGLLTIKNLSNESLPGNRLYTASGQDILLRTDSFAVFRYSQIRSRFEMLTLFGTDLLLSLAYEGTESRVVTVGPDGVLSAETMMNYREYNETSTGFASLADIVSAYPTSNGYKKGFTVVCAFMATPTIYEKVGDSDAHWIKYTVTKMV